jgi:hypothetical protein
MNRSLLMAEAIFLHPLLGFHYAGVRPFLAHTYLWFQVFLLRCRDSQTMSVLL